MGKIIDEKFLSGLSLILCFVVAYNSRYLHKLITVGEIGLFGYLMILGPWVAILIGSLLSILTKERGRIISVVAFGFALITSSRNMFPTYLSSLIVFAIGIGWLVLVIKNNYKQIEKQISSCTVCENEISINSDMCPHCGEIPRVIKVTNEDLFNCMGKNQEKYMRKFEAFTKKEGSFSVTWHWPVFFVGFWWFIYRKLYMWSFLHVLLIPFVILANPLLMFLFPVAFGMTGNYIYYKSLRKNIFQIRTNMPEYGFDNTLSARGGVNRWVIPVAVIFTVLSAGLGIFWFILQTKIQG